MKSSENDFFKNIIFTYKGILNILGFLDECLLLWGLKLLPLNDQAKILGFLDGGSSHFPDDIRGEIKSQKKILGGV